MAPADKRSHPNVTFAVLALACMTYSLLQSLVVPVLPTIQQRLHTTQDTVTWVFTAYLLSASVATPILGRLGDMVGKARLLVVTMGALAVGTALAGVSQSIGMLIVARVVQGLGGAVFPLSFGIIRDEFPPGRVAGAIGTISSLLAVGGGLGTVLAGPITSHLDYHFLFWVPFVPAAGAAVAAHFLIPESPVRSPGRLNLQGSVLLSGWLLSLLLGVSEGPQWGWGSARVAALFGAALVLFALWVVSESRAAQPLVDMRMMRLPAVWRTNLVALLFGFVMYATFAELPEFFQTPRRAGYGFHASVTESGLILLPNTIGLFVVGLMIGRLTVRFGSNAVVLAGGLLSAASLLLLVLAHAEVWQVLVATALLGIGIGLGFSAMSNLIVEAVPFEQTGVATGMNANIRTIGGAIGSQVSATLVTMGVAAGALPHESGYVHSFVVLAAASLACALVAAIIPRRSPQPVVWAVPSREPTLTLADA